MQNLNRIGTWALVVLCGAVVGELRGADVKLPGPVGWAAPDPAPATPGGDYTPPIDSALNPSEGAPVFFEHTKDAGPDQTFFATGADLGSELFAWGMSAKDRGGQSWTPKVQFARPDCLSATLPEKSFDGPFLVWAKNDKGWSRPMRLNTPELWWVTSGQAGSTIRIFGRDITRRPDRSTSHVFLELQDKAGIWLDAEPAGKYSLAASLPRELSAGEYRLWVHAGAAGAYGWSNPVTLRVHQASTPRTPAHFGPDSGDLQAFIDQAARQKKSVVTLPPGLITFSGTLRIPNGIALEGQGAAATRLQCVMDPAAAYHGPRRAVWNQAPSSIHTAGDTLDYRVKIPTAGGYTLWVRYATEMSQWKQAGMSGRTSIQIGNGAPVTLDNLPNTGSFGTYRWAKAAMIDAPAGEQALRWRNDKGGGISLDAFVLAADANWTPPEKSFPEPADKLLIVQGEAIERMVSKDGALPALENPVVWLSGDGATLSNLTVSGNPQTNIGILVASDQPLKPINDCRIEKVRVTDVEGKHRENCAVRVEDAVGCSVIESELWGRTPLFLSGAYRSTFAGNRLVPVTRFGGNSEAVILSRCERLEECIIEKNLITSPPGAEAGGPTGRRMIWISTGRGSVVHNWIAGNGVEAPTTPGADVGAGPMRFGGVAGTDQNVGEMILFEANHRTMYFGALAGADAQSVTLPKTLTPTPDDRLGNVKREQLAHDANGQETPFWPPDDFDATDEPPIHQYFISIMDGPGRGQTRRVVSRTGEKLSLDRPWTVPPSAQSTVTVGTAFFQNHIVSNHTPDGMTGIQLWISCVENIVSANTIARQRKPGVFLFASASTLASSMPRTWNRGINPLFFNHVEGTRTQECSSGALVTVGDAPNLPVEFPRALGNVLRHNSFVRNRSDGVTIVSRAPKASFDRSPSILGTVLEFNVTRDAQAAYHVGNGAEATVIRRNHAYFWFPVATPTATTPPAAGILIDNDKATVAMEHNSIEGRAGGGEASVVEVRRAGEAVKK